MDSNDRPTSLCELAVLTRREFVLGSLAAGAIMQSHSVQANPALPSTPVKFEVPKGACDCHTHIHGDPNEFPFFSGRTYTPQPALPSQLSELHRALKIKRVVIVTPSVYGSDNSATLYGIREYGAGARGVAVIDEATSERDLDRMDEAGVCGIRLNLGTQNVSDPEVGRQRLSMAIERVRRRGWHVQVFTNLKMVTAFKEIVMGSRIPIVFDHFGGAVADLGIDQPGFADLVDLVRSGKAYVKISAAYRISTQASNYSDVIPIAQSLIQANPDRILWGTDWPHPDSVTPPGRKTTDVTPLLQVDDGHLLNQLPTWAPDAAIREKILVSNPARLYQF